MKISFTPSDYMRYLYNEISTKERFQIEESLSNNWFALEEFKLYKKAKEELDLILFEPNSEICQNILSEARA
jgi:hypothetical protein